MNRLVKYSLIIGGLIGATYLPNLYFNKIRSEPVACYGDTNNGRVSGARRIKTGGAEYCWLCRQALRTYVHAPVADTIEAAYRSLNREGLSDSFMLGEAGFPWGGRFRPHKTHQNGLSVDFMVPLIGDIRLPTHIGNKFGYGLDFDWAGKGTAGEIDFAAISIFLNHLDAEARKRGGKIRRIFFAPDLQAHLPADVRRKFRFNSRPSWVRHDDHYHVDFSFKCGKA